jgi:hypothetical protein
LLKSILDNRDAWYYIAFIEADATPNGQESGMNVYQFALGNQKALARAAFSGLDEANATIEYQNALFKEWEAAVDKRDAIIQAQKARIAKLELALAKQVAHSAGLDAYLTAFKTAHKGSPVLADSGKRFKDGRIKTVGRIAYEKAHDAGGVSMPGFALAREN